MKKEDIYPTSGGRWLRDPKTGELTKIVEPPVAEPEPATPAAAAKIEEKSK